MSESPYKETLNLPYTSFPMKASLAIREKDQIQFWQEHRIYEKTIERAQGKPLYILHDGPPYANGPLHVGHALNKILKDVLVKYHTKRGFQSLYTPGWDCHGLPIEIQVQKKLSQPYSKNDFRRACRKHAENFIALQKEGFHRLLVLGDFDHRYATMDFSYEAEILSLLQQVYRKGLLYRDNRPVSWCVHCATALADAEVDYAPLDSPSLYVKYPVVGEENLSFLVWTTTPWTLPSSVALCVGEQIEYGIFSDGGQHYLLAKNLAQKIEQETKSTLQFIEDVRLDKVLSWKARHPFLSRDIALIVGHHVTLDAGTGIVHTAPAHGEEDFQVGYKQYHLPILLYIDDKGRFSSHGDTELSFLDGQSLEGVNQSVLQKLEEEGRSFSISTVSHSYPHCWRCKNPLVIRTTYQWFIRVSSLIPAMKREIEKVEFIPAERKERMLEIVNNRPDWCISRQRVWGVPIPSLKCSCGEEFFDERVLAFVQAKTEKEGADFWFDEGFSLEEHLPFIKDIVCETCGCQGDFSRGQDILDVWFDSSVSWKNLLERHYQKSLQTPINLYLEGNDQFRSWYQVSLISALVEKDKAPYKAILTHGMVLDENGRAMSKSLGNVIDPAKIVQQYGADVLRLWVLSQDYIEDMRIGEAILRQVSDMYRKLRNTFRFLLSNLYDFPSEGWKDRDISTFHELDQWALYRLDRLQKSCHELYDKGKLDELVRTLFHFVNEDLSSFYLDVLKDTLYTHSPNHPQRRSAQYTFVVILEVLMDLCAPILSFTMEEVYEHLRGIFFPREESVFLKESAEVDYHLFQETHKRLEKIREYREHVLKELENLRQNKAIGSNLEAKVTVYTSDPVLLESPYLEYYFIVSECQVIFSPGTETRIKGEKTHSYKCPRCYRYVSSSSNTLCERCQTNLQESTHG